jgi:hypothetical protein
LFEIVEDGREYFVRFMSHDQVELGEAFEDLPVQHRGVRTAE